MHDDRIDVALEVYVGDTDVMVPDGVPALGIFADGKPLTPRVLLREPRTRTDRVSPFAGMIDPRTRRQIPGPPEDDRVVYVQMRYTLDRRPAQLTFTPPFDEDGNVAATIGFVAYHKAAPINDFRYLSQAETLVLDWDDPWFTAFENGNLSRHHRWPQMSFLYIEPRQVRHEVLVRVRDLIVWSRLPVDYRGRLSESDQTLVLDAARGFFSERNPLSIDGETASQSAFRGEFLSISPTGLLVIEPGAPVDASAAILGISLSYWVETLPDYVTIEWQLFSERVDRVPTNVVDPAGPFPSFVTPEYPLIEWKNYLKGYTDLSVENVDAAEGWLELESWRVAMLGVPGKEETDRIVRDLLTNAAIAFLERDPAARDRALLRIVAEDRLSDARTDLARIFAIPTAGGGVAGIETQANLQIEQISALDATDGFSVLAGWSAQATGRHWGHVDRRALRFRALLAIGRFDDSWKLMGLTVLEAQPLP